MRSFFVPSGAWVWLGWLERVVRLVDAIMGIFVGALRPRWLEGAGCYSVLDARSALEWAEWRPVFLGNRKMASKIRWIPDAIHTVYDMSLRPKHGNESNAADAVDAMRVILRKFLRPRSGREWAHNGGKEELGGRLRDSVRTFGHEIIVR